jgi:FkbM family methyltransferase
MSTAETPGSIPLAHDGRRISFAQNGEDIVLLRAFDGQATGFWIDIGANHPISDSVTHNFSQLGWSGINVEPLEHFYRLLSDARPRDLNINAAVSTHDATMTFHRNDTNLDLSTFDDDLARRYRDGGDALTDLEVPVMTLATICASRPEIPTIDFLKIDTEGHELAVVSSHDFERWPTRVLVAEATYANLDEITVHLEANQMRLVTFDGLNAWFVHRDESASVVAALNRAPSPLVDGYHPAVYLNIIVEQHRRIDALKAELDEFSDTRRTKIRLARSVHQLKAVWLVGMRCARTITGRVGRRR